MGRVDRILIFVLWTGEIRAGMPVGRVVGSTVGYDVVVDAVGAGLGRGGLESGGGRFESVQLYVSVVVVHAVVGAKVDLFPAHSEVEDRGGDGAEGAEQGEGEHELVHVADHDSR